MYRLFAFDGCSPVCSLARSLAASHTPSPIRWLIRCSLFLCLFVSLSLSLSISLSPSLSLSSSFCRIFFAISFRLFFKNRYCCIAVYFSLFVSPGLSLSPSLSLSLSLSFSLTLSLYLSLAQCASWVVVRTARHFSVSPQADVQRSRVLVQSSSILQLFRKRNLLFINLGQFLFSILAQVVVDLIQSIPHIGLVGCVLMGASHGESTHTTISHKPRRAVVFQPGCLGQILFEVGLAPIAHSGHSRPGASSEPGNTERRGGDDLHVGI